MKGGSNGGERRTSPYPDRKERTRRNGLGLRRCMVVESMEGRARLNRWFGLVAGGTRRGERCR